MMGWFVWFLTAVIVVQAGLLGWMFGRLSSTEKPRYAVPRPRPVERADTSVAEFDQRIREAAEVAHGDRPLPEGMNG